MGYRIANPSASFEGNARRTLVHPNADSYHEAAASGKMLL